MNVIKAKPRDVDRRARRRIAVAYCAIVLLTAGLLGAAMAKLWSLEMVESRNLLTAIARLTDEQTARTLQNVDQALLSVEATIVAARSAASPPVEARSLDKELARLVLNRPYLTIIRVLDAEGRVIHSSDPGDRGLDFSDVGYFRERRARPEAGFAVGTPVKSGVGGKWILPATLAVRAADGTFAGAIVAVMDPMFFDSVWALDKQLPTLSVALFRNDGVMLMRTPVDELLIGKSYARPYFFQQVRSGIPAGVFENYSPIDGELRLFAYRQLAAYPGMILVVSLAIDEILAPWWNMAWLVGLTWAGAMMGLGGLTLWLAREWEKHRDTRDRYHQLFDASPYPTAALDGETWRFLAVNDSAVEKYGWSREELLAMSSDDLYPPEDLQKLIARRREPIQGGVRDLKGLRHRKKDGTVIDVAMILRPVDLGGRLGFLATAEDITEQLRGERARQEADTAREASEKGRSVAEEQLRQSQKMEAVGQLTGGIAHDFNNLLMVILANADELQDETDPDAATVAARLRPITDAVMRASALTRQLLAFSRKQPLNPKITDLNGLVSDTGKLLRRALGEHVEIESVLADGLWTVNIDRTQLETALVNLCVNARDAMPGGGKLLIETHNVTLHEDNITQATDVSPGDFVMLAVTDTGSGMSPEIRAQVFNPFFTTKDVGKGTGLGLSMVYGFIKQSNGHITVQSELGSGTTFRLYLPRTDGVQEEPALRTATPLPRGTERILVVEDEPLVRAGVVTQLQSLGYIVLQAADGESGLASFEAAAHPYDLLLTDVVMPGRLNGRTFADEVARRWPKTKVVFISGYAENAVLHEGRADAGVLLLSKPFRKSDLAEIVRQALDTTPGPDDVLPKAA